jgi:tetratricopeptide (TPR) repeat protein
MRGACHWLLVVLLLVGGVARADWDDEATARSLYQRGMAHFQLEEYEVAIQLWQQAYRLKPSPAFLFNIAQAYRFSSERALAFYRKYLFLNPTAPNRAEVEKQIALLSGKAEVKEAPEPAPAITPMPTRAPVAAPAPVPTKTAEVKLQKELVAKPPLPKSVVKKPWFWAGTLVVAAALAVGIGFAVVDGTKSHDPSASFGVARGN